jgi:hypothetical protein
VILVGLVQVVKKNNVIKIVIVTEFVRTGYAIVIEDTRELSVILLCAKIHVLIKEFVVWEHVNVT